MSEATPTGPSILIVGSGPGGFYCAEALLKLLPDAAIDIIDRLPTPYGLVRAGVAPDHQGTKAVTRLFDRTAQKPKVRFLGNVELGTDISFDAVAQLYDSVVLAFGAALDRNLDIPGEALAGVFGSAGFVGWYNGHPDCQALPVTLAGVRSVAVIGNGNVAVDVARVLAKTPAEMAASDIAAHAAGTIHRAAITDIHVIGRRGPIEASFTNAELAELGRLERCVPLVDARDLPAEVGAVDEASRKVKEANLTTLRGFAANRPDMKPIRLHLHFWTRPLAILGADRVEAVRLERRAPGETARPIDLPVELVVTCIGYRAKVPPGIPFDESRGIVPNEGGRVAERLYVVGWAKRGPSGVIATNRADSINVAERIAADLKALATGSTSASERPGPAGLDRLLAASGRRPVSFADWRRIDAAEVAAAREDAAPRRKLVTVADMIALLADAPEG